MTPTGSQEKIVRYALAGLLTDVAECLLPVRGIAATGMITNFKSGYKNWRLVIDKAAISLLQEIPLEMKSPKIFCTQEHIHDVLL